MVEDKISSIKIRIVSKKEFEKVKMQEEQEN